MKKYDESLLDASATFTAEEDLRNILFKDTGIKPDNTDVERISDGAFPQTVINKNALIGLGDKIFKASLSSNLILFKLSIPSENIKSVDAIAGHSTALMVDFNNKIIKYMDSYGKMRKELYDFLTALFPEYKLSYGTKVQQGDFRIDHSCNLLSEYNLRDMLYEHEGRPELVKNFHTAAAREDMYEKLKDIPKLPEQSAVNKLNEAAFKVVIKKWSPARRPTEEEIAERARLIEEAFNYRMYNEPSYEDDIKDAVKIVNENFQKLKDEIVAKQYAGSVLKN